MFISEYPGTLADPFVDLMHRDSDNIAVVLYFNRTTSEIVVSVANGYDSFGFYEVEPADALDVFFHPFFYRGEAVEYDRRAIEPADLFQSKS